MSWFQAIGNFFETRTLERELTALRTEHESLKQTVAALQAENSALKKEIADLRKRQDSATKPLHYPRLGTP